MSTTDNFRLLKQKITIYLNTILTLETKVEKLRKEKSDLVLTAEDLTKTNKKLRARLHKLEEEIQELKAAGGN
jgi:predicted RNase H-like nuclease (RuvC/YqgF family)